MAINKKLIHFKTKSNFENELANGNILDSSICFIKETKEIWTHGQLYNCSGADTTELLQTINDLSEEVRENELVAAKAISDLYTKINGTSDNGIVTFESIYPTINGTILEYRVPAGSTCELLTPSPINLAGFSCIHIIFEGVPENFYDDNSYTDNPMLSKYHIRCCHYGMPIMFTVDGAEGLFFGTNGGVAFNPSLGWCFELDALCEQLFAITDTGEEIMVGYIYPAYSVFNNPFATT